MLKHIYGNFDKAQFARFTVHVAEAAEAGDALAQHCMERAGRLLAEHIVALAHKASAVRCSFFLYCRLLCSVFLRAFWLPTMACKWCVWAPSFSAGRSYALALYRCCASMGTSCCPGAFVWCVSVSRRQSVPLPLQPSTSATPFPLTTPRTCPSLTVFYSMILPPHECVTNHCIFVKVQKDAMKRRRHNLQR